jgi:hypothetical protein
MSGRSPGSKGECALEKAGNGRQGEAMSKKKKPRRTDHAQDARRAVFKLMNVKNLSLKGRKRS